MARALFMAALVAAALVGSAAADASCQHTFTAADGGSYAFDLTAARTPKDLSIAIKGSMMMSAQIVSVVLRVASWSCRARVPCACFRLPCRSDTSGMVPIQTDARTQSQSAKRTDVHAVAGQRLHRPGSDMRHSPARLPAPLRASMQCGGAMTTCYPASWTAPANTGIAVQTWGSVPSCNPPSCKDSTGKAVCCTADCNVVGANPAMWELTDPKNPTTGGLTLTFTGTCAACKRNAVCVCDPSAIGKRLTWLSYRWCIYTRAAPRRCGRCSVAGVEPVLVPVQLHVGRAG